MNLKGSNSRALIAAVITALVMAALGGMSAFAGATKKRSAKTPAKVTTKAPATKKVAGSTTTPPAPHDEAAEHAAFAQALADKLGLPVADVTAALEALKPAAGTRPDPATFPAALAVKLGLDEATVKAALDAVRPPHGPGDHHGGPDGDGGPHGHGPHGPHTGVDPDGDNWTGANRSAPAAKAAPKPAKRR